MGVVANYGGCRQLCDLSPFMGVVANYGVCCIIEFVTIWGLSPIMGFVKVSSLSPTQAA